MCSKNAAPRVRGLYQDTSRVALLTDDLLRVLLLDADPDGSTQLEAELNKVEAFQCTVQLCTTLADALEQLGLLEPDVMLVNLELPDSSGLDTVERIRASNLTVPLVVITGNEDVTVELATIQAGAQDIISKEIFDFRLCARAIRHAIQRKAAEAQLAYMARHDQLTGLVNRSLFHDYVDQALSRTSRSDRMMALLYLDLDRFQHINDSLGTAAGDMLLKSAAQRLKSCVRAGDTVGRLGGDEFAVVLEGLRNTRDVARVAEKVLGVMSEPYDLGFDSLAVTPSIGVVMSGDDQSESGILTKSADIAMRRAKAEGGNSFCFFTPEMQVAMANRRTLEHDLRAAVAGQELVLHYQPQVELVGGRTTGMEALVRWQRGSDGILVPPNHFIPIAEETGLIETIGEWVIEEACRQTAAWSREGMPLLCVSVNLSVRQLKPGRLVSLVQRALDNSGLPANQLELEVTESLLMEDVEAARVSLTELKDIGVRISVDDFGTGYSSMNYLKRFPIDTLKIDQTFVREVPSDPDDTAITSAIIALGHALRLDVVAEGVETYSQMHFLQDQGCDRAQGFLLSRPKVASEFETWVRARSESSPEAQTASLTQRD
jgi:diguanylate cyclase (GGDEF)-like protein